MRKDTVQNKLAKLSGKMAIRSAELANDPDFKKLRKVKRLYEKLKDKIQLKYKTKGDMAAKEALRNI